MNVMHKKITYWMEKIDGITNKESIWVLRAFLNSFEIKLNLTLASFYSKLNWHEYLHTVGVLFKYFRSGLST